MSSWTPNIWTSKSIGFMYYLGCISVQSLKSVKERVLKILSGQYIYMSSLTLDWLYLRFYVPLKNFSLIWKRHHCQWRAAKFKPMLGAQSLWAGRVLYRATPAVTWDLGFSSLSWRTASFSRFLWHTRGCISVWSLKSVKQRVLKILNWQNISISNVNLPWTLTFWPQNQ
jgi:hypothetical protein